MATPTSLPPEGLDAFLAEPAPGAMPQAAPTLAANAPQSAPSGVPEGLDEFIAPELREEKYGTPGQMLQTFVEGAAKAATFGLSTGLQRAFGADKEGLLARPEVNPGLDLAGQAASLLGTSFIPGVGAGAIVDRLGAGAAKSLISGTGLVAKVGSSAVKGAVENALVQGGNEVSKMFAQDPAQSAETALADVGLATVLGGALSGGITGGVGAISPLWKATMSGKVGGFLNGLQRRLGGLEGIENDAMHQVIEDSGLQLAPEIRAAVTGDDALQGIAKTLEQSDTTGSGLKYQEANRKFRKDAGDELVRTMGAEPESLAANQFSPSEAGRSIGKTLASEYDAQMSPLAKEFGELKAKKASAALDPDKILDTGYTKPGEYDFAKLTTGPDVVVPELRVPGSMSQAADRVAKLAEEQGWLASPSSAEMKAVRQVLKELPEQKTLKDLSNYITAVGNNTASTLPFGQGTPLSRAGGLIRRVLKDVEEEVTLAKLGEEGPELVSRFQAAREAYRAQSLLKEALDDRLGVRGSTSGFAKGLKAMAENEGEAILRKLSGKDDAALLPLLAESFPQTAAAVRQQQIGLLLRDAQSGVKPGETINAGKLLKAINDPKKLSPEMRNFLFSGESLKKVEAISTLLDELNKVPHNSSNTARTIDKLTQYGAGSALGVVSMLTGAGAGASFLVGALAKPLTKDVPDAIRLAALKFLGSGEKVSADGFKAMVDYAASVAKGEAAVSKATKAVFKAGREVLPQSMMPTESDRKKLDKQLKTLQTDPKPLLNVGGKTSYYIPEHNAAIGQVAATTVNYLNSQRPTPSRKSPLDTEMPVPPGEKAAYDRLLNIAQQPLSILPRIQSGTLTPNEVMAMKTMYPALYNKVSQQLTNNMIETINKGEAVPYGTRLALSLFLGQPLDSTMTGPSIASMQPVPATPPGPQQAPKKSTSSLSKLPGMYQTSTQRAEQEKSSRKS